MKNLGIKIGIGRLFSINRKKIPLFFQIALLLTILFSNILILTPIKKVYCNPYTDIDVVTAKNMIGNMSISYKLFYPDQMLSFPSLIVLDVRNQSEYDEGHLENSTLIPVSELESRINELSVYKYTDTEILVYSRTGVRSVQASNILDSNDFTKVFNVLGGITAWESNGYTIIPEFPSWIILTLFVTATLVVTLARKKFQK